MIIPKISCKYNSLFQLCALLLVFYINISTAKPQYFDNGKINDQSPLFYDVEKTLNQNKDPYGSPVERTLKSFLDLRHHSKPINQLHLRGGIPNLEGYGERNYQQILKQLPTGMSPIMSHISKLVPDHIPHEYVEPQHPKEMTKFKTLYEDSDKEELVKSPSKEKLAYVVKKKSPWVKKLKSLTNENMLDARGRAPTEPDYDVPNEQKVQEGLNVEVTDWSTESESWSFTGGDWTKLNLPDPNYNIPSPELPGLALVAVSDNPMKKLYVSRNIGKLENITLHFMYYMSRPENSYSPILKVYVVTPDFESHALNIETIEGGWYDETIKIEYPGPFELKFEAQLMSPGNQIALDDISIMGYSRNNSTNKSILRSDTNSTDINNNSTLISSNITDITNDNDNSTNSEVLVNLSNSTATIDDTNSTNNSSEGSADEAITDLTIDQDEGSALNETVSVQGSDNNDSVDGNDENSDSDDDNDAIDTEINDTSNDGNKEDDTNDDNGDNGNENTGDSEAAENENEDGTDHSENDNADNEVDNTDDSEDTENNGEAGLENSENIDNDNGDSEAAENESEDGTDNPENADNNEVDTGIDNDNNEGNSETTVEDENDEDNDDGIEVDTNNNTTISEDNYDNSDEYDYDSYDYYGYNNDDNDDEINDDDNNDDNDDNNDTNNDDNGDNEDLPINENGTTNTTASSETYNELNAGLNDGEEFGASESSDDVEASSHTWTVFKIFFILTVLGACAIGILYWRNKRRFRDDEIPVFNRGNYTDFHNPTFNEDQTELDSSTLNTSSKNDYRSFK